MNWLRAIGEPQSVAGWSLAEWDRVIRLARRHRLLARLDAALTRAGLGETVPAPARAHLVAARHLSVARARAVAWVVERLPAMLGHPEHPLVLLKGAAYVAQHLRIADGRLPSDLDILVPHEQLGAVQQRLTGAGWREPDLDEHDRHYYIAWSHELPPMVHEAFEVELDVHHNILPPRDGRSLDATRLLQALQPTDTPPWQTLGPADQVIHCAAHLFFDAEPSDRVRDLVDIDGLLRHFGSEPEFWPTLRERAEAMGLLEPLCMACRFAIDWLATPIDPHWLDEIVRAAGWGWPQRGWSSLFRLALQPSEPDRTDSVAKRAAAVVLLARYHAHRLPPTVLVPHLWRKWRLRVKAPAIDADAPGPR